MVYLIAAFQTTIVFLTLDSAQAVRILELTLKDNGDVATKINGEIHCYGAHAQAVYSVFVCLCVCRLLQLLKDQWSASKSFYRLLDLYTWFSSYA